MDFEWSSLAITERKDKKEIYLAETKATIYNTKIILKNAYLLILIQAFIHVQTAGGDEALKIKTTSMIIFILAVSMFFLYEARAISVLIY